MRLAGDFLDPDIYGDEPFVGLIKKTISSHSNCQWHLELLVMNIYRIWSCCLKLFFRYCCSYWWLIVSWWFGYLFFAKKVLNIMLYFLVQWFRHGIIRALHWCFSVSSFRRIFMLQFWTSPISSLSSQNTSNIFVIKSTAFWCWSVDLSLRVLSFSFSVICICSIGITD